MSQLGFRQLLGDARFLPLQLGAVVLLLFDRLARARGMHLQLFDDRLEARLVVGAHPPPHLVGGRIRRRAEASEPGFVLAALLEQALDLGGALRGSLRHPRPGTYVVTYKCKAWRSKFNAGGRLWRCTRVTPAPRPGRRAPSRQPRASRPHVP